MKIFFVAILIAVAADAQVTLDDFARSYVRTALEFNSMTDREKEEATQSLREDWVRAFGYELYLTWLNLTVLYIWVPHINFQRSG